MSKINNNMTYLNYRPDIDGLRGIAVLAVILYHAFPDLVPGGYIGVDIFFVISGFLISSILFKSIDDGSFKFFEFYNRRIRRIFPALLIVLFACSFVGYFTLLPDEYNKLGVHVSAGVSFVSNFVLQGEVGYFEVASETKPLLHLWSLAIEEQYYLFWPLFLWFLNKKNLNIFTFTFLLLIASLTLNFYNFNNAANFYSPFTRFWELLSGGLLAFYYLNNRELLNVYRYKFDNYVNGLVFREKLKEAPAFFINIISFLGLFCYL